MSMARGIVLFVLGVFALYKGWTIHTGQRAWLAYGLGLVAIALGVDAAGGQAAGVSGGAEAIRPCFAIVGL